MTLTSSGWPMTSGATTQSQAGGTPFSVKLHPVDPYGLRAMMKFGGRTDNVWSYHDVPGYKEEMGPGRYGNFAGSSFRTGSGRASINYMGRGGTPSNPGGYNWDTLSSAVDTTVGMAGNAFNAFMDKKFPNSQNEFLDQATIGNYLKNYRVSNAPLYNSYAGAKQKLAKGQAQRRRDLKRQERAQMREDMLNQATIESAKQESLNTFASNQVATSQMLAAGVVAGKSPKVKPGASSPLRGNPSTNVNLLTGPTALGQPKKAARNPANRKPKAARPTPPATELNNPENW